MQTLTWESFKKYDGAPKTPPARSERVEAAYKEWKNILEKNDCALADYIKDELICRSNGANFIITYNRFPCILPDNCLALIVWEAPATIVKKFEPMNIDDIREMVSEIIDDDNFVLFENEYHNRSVPEIKHFHLILHLDEYMNIHDIENELDIGPQI